MYHQEIYIPVYTYRLGKKTKIIFWCTTKATDKGYIPPNRMSSDKFKALSHQGHPTKIIFHYAYQRLYTTNVIRQKSIPPRLYPSKAAYHIPPRSSDKDYKPPRSSDKGYIQTRPSKTPHKDHIHVPSRSQTKFTYHQGHQIMII